MRKNEDFKIQEILDQKMKESKNLTSEMLDTDDLKAYELLYAHLKEKPECLSLSFKSNVLRRIVTERKQASDTMFYWLLIFIFLIGLAIITSMFFIFKDVLTPTLSVMVEYKGFITIGIVAVVIFTIVEKKLTNTRFDSIF